MDSYNMDIWFIAYISSGTCVRRRGMYTFLNINIDLC